jgi:hypothetical protein
MRASNAAHQSPKPVIPAQAGMTVLDKRDTRFMHHF